MLLGCLPRARRGGVRRFARTGERDPGVRLGCLPRAWREGVQRFARTGERDRACGWAIFLPPGEWPLEFDG